MRSLSPRLTLLVTVAVVTSVAAGRADAQSGPSPRETSAPSVQTELARINGTLARIVELLERNTETQRLGLLLKRVELESDRVADLESELRRLESTRGSLEDERFRIQSRLASLADQIESSPADVSRDALQDLDSMASEAERMLERLGDQIDGADARMAGIESELSRRRSDLQALRDQVDRALQGD